MNNIFNQILEEVLLEEETEAVRNINKRKLAKWAYVEGSCARIYRHTGRGG